MEENSVAIPRKDATVPYNEGNAMNQNSDKTLTQLNIEIPKELHHRLRVVAAIAGESIRELTMKIISEGIERRREDAAGFFRVATDGRADSGERGVTLTR
jgi:hypothetical protein